MVDDVVADRPDLVLIMTDQQRFDQVGYASGGHFETPTLDALAARGVIFDAAYSASTVCVPARAALMTGLQPHRLPTQENGVALREGFWTVAHELRSAGYETALIGKMHFAPVHARHGFDTMRLCEHLRSQGLGPLSEARHDEVDDYHDWLVEHDLTDWRLTNDRPAPRRFPYPADAHPTAWVEREVSAFLAARDRRRPLFLVISFPHPHAPYDPPEPYASMYDPADSVVPTAGYEVNDQLPFAFHLAMGASPTRSEGENPRQVRAFLAIVRGLVKQIDDALGRITAELNLDTTVVFFTSDHGDYAGHRGLMRKKPWVPFDDLARVPFFVTGGGIAGGRRVPQLVQNSDFALTCLDYAGVAAPAGVPFETRSLRPVLDGAPGPDDLDRHVFSGISVEWPMVRHGRYKFIRHGVHEQQAVLFDLEADPLEHVNLFRDPSYADVRDALAARLQETMRQPVLDVPAPPVSASTPN
jgi:choline-sulfatase